MRKRSIKAISCLFLLIAPLAVAAQDGLGKLDYTGKRGNRPVVQKSLTHPNGAKATCFSLPGNSCNADDCRTDRERAQLLQRKPDNLEGQAYRYAFSMYLPANFEDVRPANLILWEVKPRGNGKPSAVVEIVRGRLQFSLSDPGQTQANKMTPLKPTIIKSLGSIPRGRWAEFIVEAKWSRGSDGKLRVYHNGRLVVQHNGPNIDSNSSRQQVMYGLYRSFISRYFKATGRSEMPLQQACFANVARQRVNM